MKARKGKTNVELKRYVEHLEQKIDEALMVKELGEDYFKMPKEHFIKMPGNMTATEYQEWRKSLIFKNIT